MSKDISAAIKEAILNSPSEFYGEKQLRWAQIAAKNATIQHLENGIRTILICMPTGVGKTITFACLMDCPDIHKALKIEQGRPLRVLVIAHINHLLTQAERTFADANNVEIRTHTPFSKIPQSVIDWCDIVTLDECHHEAMMSIQLQLDSLINKPLIGITATKDRADGMVIKFEEIVEPVSRIQAVEEGWLAETSLWSFLDLSGRDKTHIICTMLNEYHHVMGQTIIFVRTKAEVRNITDHLNQALGLKAVALLNQSKSEMTLVLDQFSAGEHQFLVNCNKIGEGVDLSNCQSAVIGKQLGSYPQLNQYIGRTARPDSESQIFEFINPLSGRNLDTTVVTGEPKKHVLCTPNKKTGKFNEIEFDYTNHANSGGQTIARNERLIG